ncbi:type II secretion system GspH family protein [Patescibacteria group bacterium]|nr:type II secretion system GspH family protein [Patescibacteria group bacterium]MCL5409935.1 type II secretion system GspH family protein [Patescibacteria group bacterium]
MPTSKILGFTLIELLVTISIIAVLATISVISFSSVQRNGRDAKRESDLRNIQAAIEQYHADQNYYPATILIGGGAITNPDGTKTYMSKVPNDPQSAPSYAYFPQNASGAAGCDNSSSNYCTKYYLCAKLEGSIPSSSTVCSPDTTNYNFGVVPQ